MPSDETQFKSNYDMENTLNRVCEYFINHDRTVIKQTSLRKVYDNVVAENKTVKMPKYSMFRNYLIDMLSEYGLYDSDSNEKVTSIVALRLLEIYIGDLELIFEEYPMKIIQRNVIPCIIPLPDADVLEQLTTGIQEVKGGTKRDRRKSLINQICRNIKKKHSKVVVAAVSEANPLISDKPPNEKKNMLPDEANPVFTCFAICLYVIDSEQGREFIRYITKKDAIKQYI